MWDNNTTERSGAPITCLIWGTGRSFRECIDIIKEIEKNGEITVRSVTSNDSGYTMISGYPFVSKADIDMQEIEAVIVMATDKSVTNEIIREAVSRGAARQKIVPCCALRLPGFDINKYLTLRKDPPTIFAPNCWGGNTYHSLGLRFDSPLINMYEDHDDYLTLLEDPKYYMSQPLIFTGMRYEENLKRDYPVARCGDILLYLNHYESFDEAETAWARRKERINWDRLFVMFYDEDPQRVKRFTELPYHNKICFAPFAFDDESVCQIEIREDDPLKEFPFWKIVNGMATGLCPYYDVFELLLNTRIVKVPDHKLTGERDE